MSEFRAFMFKLAEKIHEYHRKVSGKAKAEMDDVKILADLHGYFLYKTLKCDRDEAYRLIENFELLANWFYREKEDVFHVGFFFALGQLLTLKYEVATLPHEFKTYNEWLERFNETMKQLGMKEIFRDKFL